MPASSAVNAAVTTVMRSLKSRLITAGISTLAIAIEAPMSAVPSQRFTAEPGRERHTVPTAISTSDQSTTRGIPNRALSPCAKGDTTANAMSGTAASAPRAASLVPRSSAIWVSNGPTPVIVALQVRGDQQDGDEQKQARRTSGIRRACFFDDQCACAARASASMWAIERVSWNARMPSIPCSRPMPDCFMPPNGARRSRRVAPWSLTHT